MKKSTGNNLRGSFRLALLAFTLLLIGASLACFVWVRNAQRQYALGRQLIEALKKADTKQAIRLVDAGADPNTRLIATPFPSLPVLVNQLLRRSPSSTFKSATALMYACGAAEEDEIGNYHYNPLSEDTLFPLIQAMLVHGANINAKDSRGWTALLWIVVIHPRKELVQQLVAYGADPNNATVVWGDTPLKAAERNNRSDLVALLRRAGKHP